MTCGRAWLRGPEWACWMPFAIRALQPPAIISHMHACAGSEQERQMDGFPHGAPSRARVCIHTFFFLIFHSIPHSCSHLQLALNFDFLFPYLWSHQWPVEMEQFLLVLPYVRAAVYKNKALFRCSQTTKTFGEMSTFWKNESKQKLVKLGCKDLEFGILELQNCVNLLRNSCLVCCTPKKIRKHLNTYLNVKFTAKSFGM